MLPAWGSSWNLKEVLLLYFKQQLEFSLEIFRQECFCLCQQNLPTKQFSQVPLGGRWIWMFSEQGSIRYGEYDGVKTPYIWVGIYNWQSPGHFSISFVGLMWMFPWILFLWCWKGIKFQDLLILRVTLALVPVWDRFRFKSPLCHLLDLWPRVSLLTILNLFPQLKNGYDII